jgi:hypothetical protein
MLDKGAVRAVLKHKVRHAPLLKDEDENPLEKTLLYFFRTLFEILQVPSCLESKKSRMQESFLI